MGCEQSTEVKQTKGLSGSSHSERLPKRPQGVGHTERMRSRQMSMYKKPSPKKGKEEKAPPKLDGSGQLMPEEVVKRTTSSIQNKQVVLGRDDVVIDVEYAFLTQRGYYPDDVHKANQDDYSITHKVGGEEGDSLFVVYDGHGREGESCARYAKKKLPQLIAKYVRQERSNLYRKHLRGSGQSIKGAFNPKLWPILTEEQYESACKKAHLECNNAMHEDASVRDKLSGTTAVSACFNFGRLTVCNVGDSRVVLGHRVPSEGSDAEDEKKVEEEKEEEQDPTEVRAPPQSQNKTGKLLAVPLSRDQTPYRKDERERVKATGATVMSIDQMEGDEPMHENWGDMVLGEDIDVQGDPPRVWLPGKDYPGCAFTRSIGDGIADDLGVIAEPEMLTTKLTTNDEILVIASDGVFEFLTNQAVIDICSKCDNPLEACQKVVKASYKQWLHYEDRTDDITIIVCFMQCNTPPLEDVEGTTEELVGLARDSSGLKPIRKRSRKNSNGDSQAVRN